MQDVASSVMEPDTFNFASISVTTESSRSQSGWVAKVACGVWPDQYMSRRFLQRQYDIREEEENAARNRYEERRILRLLEMT